LQELVQAQLRGIEQQEQVLDRLGQSVTRVHSQATAIHGEVQGQVDLVQSLDYDMESVQGRVAFARDKVEEVFRRMDKKLFYFFCFIVPFLLTIIVIHMLKFVLRRLI
jgi:t-SNARE complex subunit (syntaxin)